MTCCGLGSCKRPDPDNCCTRNRGEPEIDANLYPKGIAVSDAEIQAINISRHKFHGEWNYTIAPNQQPP
jgi:hypothetical protein